MGGNNGKEGGEEKSKVTLKVYNPYGVEGQGREMENVGGWESGYFIFTWW